MAKATSYHIHFFINYTDILLTNDFFLIFATVQSIIYLYKKNKNILAMIETIARSILPRLGKVKSQWMGFRPTLPDSLPVIGESRKCKNVYYAFGHQHLGLSLAAVTGKVIQSLIENQPTNINIDSLSPYRF